MFVIGLQLVPLKWEGQNAESDKGLLVTVGHSLEKKNIYLWSISVTCNKDDFYDISEAKI